MRIRNLISKFRAKLRAYPEFRYTCMRYFAWLKTESKIRISHPQLGFDTHVRFVISNPAYFIVGENVWIDPFSEILVIHQCQESPITGKLEIGDRVWIGARANIRAAGGSIKIGADCLLAQNVSIIASNHAAKTESSFINQAWRTDKTGVAIGTGVWIGAGATILPGVKIGNNSIIGAGSVVTSNVGHDEVWAGIPARRLNVR